MRRSSARGWTPGSAANAPAAAETTWIGGTRACPLPPGEADRKGRLRASHRRLDRPVSVFPCPRHPFAFTPIAVLGSVFAWQSHQRGQTLTEVETLVSRYTSAEDGGAAGGAERRSLTEAITAIAEGAASDPRYRQALALIKDGKPAEAEPLLKAVAEDKKKLAAKQNREAAAAFRNLAAIAQVSDPARARDYYAEAANLDPNHLEGLYWHGEMQRDAGNLDTSEAAFNRIAEKGVPGSDDWSLFWARMGLGDLQVARGDLTTALKSYRDAFAIVGRLADADPGNAQWQRDLAWSHRRLANYGGDPKTHWGEVVRILKALDAEGRLAPVEQKWLPIAEESLAALKK